MAALCCAALAGGLVAGAGLDGLRALASGDAPPADEAADHGAEPADDGHGTQDGYGGTGTGTGAEQALHHLDEMIVNVTSASASGRLTTRFLKVNVAIVYDPAAPGADELEARTLFLRDTFQDYLRQLSETELEGSLGLHRLKAELLRRARAVVGGDAPQEILVSDLIIQ
ncbi:flagellar M-ring protein [Oceanicola granulosus HTCC2516]|uniref:Flagellar protein FliL n=1 Tax=Oceanicola granulosus (strain ATCC BAA-861 / DSM 15982 / KCTC 12143 / HTCC2516) TaxID=314256 RepID=Q2CGI1_OCEGH|nr:flagellar M-ring protein [Oceanicola granulosus HTCC2516]